MTLFQVAQLQIAVLGLGAIWLITTSPRAARLGFAFGLINLWAWFYTSWVTQSWGILFINVVYGISYVRGLRNYARERICK